MGNFFRKEVCVDYHSFAQYSEFGILPYYLDTTRYVFIAKDGGAILFFQHSGTSIFSSHTYGVSPICHLDVFIQIKELILFWASKYKPESFYIKITEDGRRFKTYKKMIERFSKELESKYCYKQEGFTFLFTRILFDFEL